VTGCDISADLAALYRGRRAQIRETARITITWVPVPEPSAGALRPTAGRTVIRSYAGSDRPRSAPHLIIESARPDNRHGRDADDRQPHPAPRVA
jgi:hypothetical protein